MSDPDIAFATLDRKGSERFQALRRELGVSSFGMNLLVLEPGQRGRIHAHDRQEEVYLVLEGELTLGVEGVEHVLGEDRMVRVGRGCAASSSMWDRSVLCCWRSVVQVSTSVEMATPGAHGRKMARANPLRRSLCPTTCRTSRSPRD